MRIGYIYFLLITLGLSVSYFLSLDLGAAGGYGNLAGIFFAERVSEDQIKTEYRDGRLKVLLVPGHEQFTGGTEYNGIAERDVVLLIGKYLHAELTADPNVRVMLLRSGGGDFSTWFRQYMAANSIDVRLFRARTAIEAERGVQAGLFTRESNVDHNEAPTSTALVLYGVNKLANEQEINLVIHIHINDYPRPNVDAPGKYRGWAIYVPENQLPNARISYAVADSIAYELTKVADPSNYGKEQPAVVEDQELIALGSNGSRNGVSLLIEYGYIYESQFQDDAMRDSYARDMAHATYLGLLKYFNAESRLSVGR